ncbi:MAG: FIG097052: Sugar transporter [uncultured Sulfurovum sp.]|uniref:FIG097052: Sugar transporter n=1 Tax=uncultured Sulfurovum sp. TaxID=269237 RepID=A0A6S6TK47_9BACT|nr:MAG: FIG097052: Sugar transporter [uncultured Sulfurovum sp.]
MPALPLALLGLPLYVYLPTYYAQDLGLGVFLVGTVLLLARVLDMFLDPIIGYYSDRYATRKNMMFFGMSLLLIGFYFLTNPSTNADALWLLFFSILVYFGWSLMTIPYLAFGADLGQSYKENNAYASYREVFNILGVLVALILPYVLGVADKVNEALALMNQVILVLLPLMFLLFVLTNQGQVIRTKEKSFKAFYALFITQLKSAKYLFLAFLLNNFANAIPATLFLLYVEFVIGSVEKTGLLLIIYFTSGILALPFWNYIAQKTSKKQAWIYSMTSASFFFAFVPFLGAGDFMVFLLITIFTGFSLGADMALPASIQADVAQKAQKAQKEVSGTLFGFFAMLTKLSLALGVGVSFGILGIFEFSTVNPTESSLLMLSLLYAFLPIVLKIVAIWVVGRYEEKL